jgi:hypothetical protein
MGQPLRDLDAVSFEQRVELGQVLIAAVSASLKAARTGRRGRTGG